MRNAQLRAKSAMKKAYLPQMTRLNYLFFYLTNINPQLNFVQAPKGTPILPGGTLLCAACKPNRDCELRITNCEFISLNAPLKVHP
jgi:hypothetical protein